MMARALGFLLGLLAAAAPLLAAAAEAPVEPAATRSGREIYQRFRDGLADPVCKADASTRWQAHYAHAPRQLASGEDVLPLFGYVVDAVRDAHLPSEYALIPFIESGYKPGARSPQGPAGLWQMIAITARNHKVPLRAGYDGRLSPVDSTTAAVRYLKTLHGMFAGDWRLAVMAYNAGEYRVLGALKRAGQTARNAQPETLPGLAPITHAYVRKLHALSCLLEQADDRDEWLRALDRPVPVLRAVEVPDGVADIATWARRTGQNAAQLQRLNPAHANGRLSRGGARPPQLLAMAGAPDEAAKAGTYAAVTAPAAGQANDATAPASGTSVTAVADDSVRRHVVRRGDSVSAIAARYRVSVPDLLGRNGLARNSILRPGDVLLVDAHRPAGDVPTAAATSP